MLTEHLATYLNDHSAAAMGGVELVRRAASAQRGGRNGPELARLADEVAEDRQSLLVIMRRLDVPVRQYKVVGGWALEKVGRLKLNGSLLSRSPLSSLVELEGLLMGVHGKLALWQTLRALADDDERLDAVELERLVSRAEGQLKRLEDMRLQTSMEVLGGAR